MSGCSYDTNCPNCNSSVGAYTDHKPFEMTIIGPCLECGFFTDIVVRYLDLEEINEAREEYNHDMSLEDDEKLLPLSQLPAQEEF